MVGPGDQGGGRLAHPDKTEHPPESGIPVPMHSDRKFPDRPQEQGPTERPVQTRRSMAEPQNHRHGQQTRPFRSLHGSSLLTRPGTYQGRTETVWSFHSATFQHLSRIPFKTRQRFPNFAYPSKFWLDSLTDSHNI